MNVSVKSDTARQVGHIPSLNGLRAVSFLLVFGGHIGLGDIIPGGFGVTVFFFLSGFLITTLLRAEYLKNGSISLQHFWIRRCFRILPPFYLVLIACSIATILLTPGVLYGPAVAARAFQYTNYWLIYKGQSGGPMGTAVYWSLAVEEHFYLLFPLLYIFLQRLRLTQFQQACVFWALCAVILLWRCALVGLMHAPPSRTYAGTDTRMDSILFGCALAVWRNPVLDAHAISSRLWKWVITPAALIAFLACFLIRNDVYRETVRYSIQGFALTFVFVAAIRFPTWLPFRILNWRPIDFIGVLSYSLYLMHMMIIESIQRLLPTLFAWEQASLAFVIALLSAWIVYLTIEKPFARLRRRFTD